MNKSEFKAVHIEREPGVVLSPVERFGPDCAERARRFHRSFPEYTVTPLAQLGALAKELGVESIHVKDESFRFSLNAFKVLGSSHAIQALSRLDRLHTPLNRANRAFNTRKNLFPLANC